MSKYNAIIGPVVEGKKIARQLGYPTMNLDITSDCILEYGVYSGTMEYKGIIYPGVINIGITPNHLVSKAKLEIHVFDYNKELYGEFIKITPLKYLRKEKKFDSIELLVKQIENDCLIAKETFK